MAVSSYLVQSCRIILDIEANKRKIERRTVNGVSYKDLPVISRYDTVVEM